MKDAIFGIRPVERNRQDHYFNYSLGRRSVAAWRTPIGYGAATRRVHKEYYLPFAELGVGADLREVKKHPDYNSKREEILSMIWEMEEEIMGRTEEES